MSADRITSERHPEATRGRSARRARRDAGRLAEALLALEPPRPDKSFQAPRPGRAASLAAAPVFILLVLAAFGILPWRAAGPVAALLLTLGLVRVGLVWRDLWTSRRLADRLLVSSRAGPQSPLAAWRAEELTTRAARRRLQRLARGMLRESEASLGADLSVGERQAVRDDIALLRRLDARLGDPAYPVAPSGMLAVSSLVCGDRWSPLYHPERAADLVDALGDAFALL